MVKSTQREEFSETYDRKSSLDHGLRRTNERFMVRASALRSRCRGQERMIASAGIGYRGDEYR